MCDSKSYSKSVGTHHPRIDLRNYMEHTAYNKYVKGEQINMFLVHSSISLSLNMQEMSSEIQRKTLIEI
jgi:hypothetical protein